MRIALDAMLLGGKHSGVEVAIESLCRALVAAGTEHEFLLLHRGCYAPAWPGTGQPRMHGAPGLASGKLGRILWEQLCLPGVVRAWGADLLHAPGYVLPLRWPGPAVVTVYDILAITRPQWCTRANSLHYGRLLPATVRRADAVIVPSATVRDEIQDVLGAPEAKLRVIPLGVSPSMRPAGDEAIERVRRAHGLSGPYLLWVGNLEPKKNLPGLVAAFEALARDLPHQLVLAGAVGWKASEALGAIEASPLRERIHRIGYVADSDMPALYSGADLLVHWSLYEGAGLTPLEAMACGTPAVVSDGGALGEIAGQVAPVVPLGDAAALAREIEAVVTNPAHRAHLRERGLEWVRQFTWERHARAVLALYSEVVHGAA